MSVADPLPAAGVPAPELCFEGAGGPVALTEACRAHGAWVFFLPLAGAPVCRADVAALVRAAPQLSGAGLRPLLVVSVDRAGHGRRFLAEAGGGLTHVSDPELRVAAAFGVAHAGGFAERASFLVGRDGRILRGSRHPLGFPRPVDELAGWIADSGL